MPQETLRITQGPLMGTLNDLKKPMGENIQLPHQTPCHLIGTQAQHYASPPSGMPSLPVTERLPHFLGMEKLESEKP